MTPEQERIINELGDAHRAYEEVDKRLKALESRPAVTQFPTYQIPSHSHCHCGMCHCHNHNPFWQVPAFPVMTSGGASSSSGTTI